ncbi:tensin-2 isoform X8 [Culex quinquefasciatus]|uniref:tensin-2 isoform X8 n=1 Tax=Culex quinquefasciatus TaxID=7176 RepID=UPI0018E3DE5D|nr:tensin-2 isoform X8 [Culex quinquefasciatus]
MPWGCLCSKEKKRPQISSPILKSDESAKQQLLPASGRRPQQIASSTAAANASKLEQRLLAGDDPSLNNQSSNTADESSEEFAPNGSGGLKRDRLQQQLIQKSKLKSSNLKSTTYTRNTENDKLTRHLNNVTFAFDEPQRPQGGHKVEVRSGELIRLDDEGDGNGNYDVLQPPQVAVPSNPPELAQDVVLQIVEKTDENSNVHLRVPQQQQPDIVKSSTESIPYIDAEQSQILKNLNRDPNKVRNFHDARIITLTPKNVGSQATRALAGPSSPELRQLVQAKKEPEPEVAASSTRLAQFSHSFHILTGAAGCDRVCQQCHLVLSLDVALRCAICEFTCHQRCVLLQQKNHEDEQQQVINKYNSLPLHALQNQQQQHQYQSPHLQQSRPASSLSHVNNNNGNHYHNYSSAHQHHHNNNNNNGLHQSPSWSNGNATGPDGPLRLSYVTERILASILPARRHRYRNGSTTPQPTTTTTPGGSPGFVDEHERELIEMLEQKHERNYRIFDLESCIASISLEKLCELCKHIDSWLGSGKEKIVVLQDRSDKQRLGAAIAAYLEYQKICGSNFPQSNRTKALPSPGGGPDGRRTPTWLDLDLYSTQRFLESVTGPLRVPSHKRYIRYFSGLLAGTIKMNASSVFLRAIIVESPPCLHYRAVTVNSEWRSFIKVYEGVRCLFTSDIYVIPITTRQFIYEIKHPLRLRGDVLVRCYQIIPNNNKLHDEKELVSAVQFHTCAITEKEVQFAKLELDLACDDERFPADHKLTLCIDTVPNEKSAILVFQNPLVRIEPIIENGDHLETINGGGWSSSSSSGKDESNHTQGPLDGSLYATILKSPKSPTATGSQQTLISPPAEFSNGKPLNGSGNGGPPPVTPPPRSSTPGAYLYESAKRYHQSANGTATLQRPNAASSHSNDSNNNNNNISGNYRDVIENGSASASASGYDQNQNPLSGGSGVGVRDSGRGSAGVHHHSSSTTTTQIRSQADGRESSVRSPLTLSMDSGISSSGAVNRRLQGSSVSPSSFPSQASPQDDRHRELDDLLSDMLMTVQGIPDAVNRNNSKNHHQQSAQHHQADHFVNTSTDTIKRSHSAQLPALREEPLAKERELLLYETSSTTTTLTPPSESGRDTPLLSSTSNYSTIRDKRELTGGAPLTPTERELIMNLQHQQQQLNHQSFGYPRQARSTTGASERFTSDDDDDTFARPYHAREDSRPFTYGSIPTTGTPQNPPASTMIKMQSGLSSPSMVRKALGTPNSTRKSATSAGVTFGNGMGGGGRNSDFEEMLRERRDKVLSEKYTIGDQQSSPGGGLNGTDTVDNAGTRYYQKTVKTVTTEHGTANGYPHEPLKRSNTMDGSFGRQFSNDGISGQTWLQLQQQKLRARKEQQKREHSNSFSYSYGSPAFPTGETPLYHSGTTQHRRSQTLSPVRISNNERNYHTLTTTTRTHSTERPFVAVKRAHENAKMQTIGAREESFSSYRSETEPDNSPTGGSPRPETPAFPVTPRTPYGLSNGTSSPALPPKSPTSQRKYNSTWSLRSQKSTVSTYDLSKDLFTGQRSQEQLIQNQNETMSCYTSRRNSTTSNANSEPQEVAPQFVKFARDSSKYWYKPAISREEAIGLLRNAAPGTFVVRDSTTFANAYGLVVKVAHPPPGVQPKAGGSNGDELVRHFLVEPTIRGVRLKGCSNEPVFTSLSALVYQHSITPLALPCRLIIPDTDLQQTDFQSPAQQQLLTQGAACNVLYLFTCDTESLTGPQAIRKAVGLLLSLRPLPKPTQVHYKVSIQGITLTDNTRQLFFRRHYPSNNVSFCGLDPDEHRWSIPSTTGDIPASKRIFAFVAKRSPTSADNQCHVFCELEATQPATAIVSFANKVVLGGGGSASNQPQQPVARAI